MPRADENSKYTLHVCSHLRLVVYAWEPLHPPKYDADTGQRLFDYGWFHVDQRGALLGMNACQASIHRFEMKWPDDCTNLDHMLLGEQESRGLTRLKPTPNAHASYQLRPGPGCIDVPGCIEDGNCGVCVDADHKNR
jgi:hypothetical protein